ncbi:MAG: transposase [Victivallales bacterium]
MGRHGGRHVDSDPPKRKEPYGAKKNESRKKLTEEFQHLWAKCRPAFSQRRCWQKAGELALCNLISFGRHTITGMLSASGRQDTDWSAAYRLFEKRRVDTGVMFEVPLKTLVDSLPPGSPVIGAIDDTQLRKTGKRVYGTAWKRDPLGPKFNTNFVWAQRWLQISVALPEANGRCRAIPVDFHHCPSAKKPGRKAGLEEISEYRRQQKAMAMPLLAVARLGKLRERIPTERRLVISGDGAYTNRTICRHLPPNTVFLGRIRKDARLFASPDESPARGRKCVYGQQMPTPEEIRQDEQVGWREVKAATGDKLHTFKIKTVKRVRSKISGNQDLKLIIVQPLRYRLSAKSKLLYREPAYIVSTDPELDEEKILQWYLWRWEIELNFRDEKNIFGIDEAMVRTKDAVETLPPFIASSYAMLLLAGRKSVGEDTTNLIAPKWRNPASISRPSTNHYLSRMRQEIFQMFAKNNFEGFREHHLQSQNTFLFMPNIQSVVVSARK